MLTLLDCYVPFGEQRIVMQRQTDWFQALYKWFIANSGKVGESVAGDLLGRLAGAAAGDSGNASRRQAHTWRGSWRCFSRRLRKRRPSKEKMLAIALTPSVLQALRLNNQGAAPLALQNRFQLSVPITARRVSIIATAFYLVACGSSIGDSIDKLGGGPEEQAAARHELVLARNVIEPLIAALEMRDDTKVRAEVANILVGLMVRSRDERIAAVLEKHLLNDPEPVVRGRIAEELGLHLRSEFFDLFLQAVSDSSPLVQAPALLSLSNVMEKLSEEQTQRLRQLASEKAKAEDKDTREAALYLVEEYVAQWAKKAREAALKANLSEADSLLGVAVAYAPASKQARYYQGEFYFDYMERERGIEMLRTHRLLVDVPKLESPPTIDGRLGDEAWEGAAKIDSFYVHGSTRTTNPSQVQTHVVMGYSDTALYWGAHCFDAHPESLVVLPFEDEAPGKSQDYMMFRLDRNMDTKVALMFVNTLGLQRDSWNDFNEDWEWDKTWDADAKAAAYVGDDFWSVEYELRWDPIYHPPPVSGEISGMNFIRLFRAIEWSHPFVGYDNKKARGFLLFQ